MSLAYAATQNVNGASLGVKMLGMKRTVMKRKIEKIIILQGFLTCYIIPVSSGWVVRINGKFVQKSYQTPEEARSVAIRGAKKLLKEANINIEDPVRIKRWKSIK